MYILSSDTLISGINSSIIYLMLDLVNKSLVINIDDQEYIKMKEKLLTINKKSLTDEIFYEERFNVI